MKFTIKDRITTAEPNAVLSYALDYRAEFEVDDEWADKVITARFVHSNGEYIDVVLDNFGCNIPLFPKGVLWVGAYTDEFTSTAVPVPIGVTIKDLGEHEAIPPTADVYQQIIALIEAGRLKGDKGDPGDDYVITESDYQAIADRVPQPDLSDYVKNTDYATSSKGGVVKVNPTYDATSIYDGRLKAESKTISQYTSLGDNAFISKGTLENVLNERLKEPQFELIEEITLTEDTDAFSRKNEPNGTPYNLKRIMVTLEGIFPSVVNGYASFAVFSDTRTYSEAVGIFSNYINTGYRIVYCNAKVENGRIFGNCSNYGHSSNSNGQALNSTGNGMGGLEANYIKGVSFYKGSTNFPAGITIKIYGVRA